MSNKVLPLKEISIAELYNSSNKIIYEVPIYQRNYAWEKEEITTLIQDTYDAYKSSLNKIDTPIYFIGTLVTFHKGDNVYEVIDGQQRLTTINLILHALNVSVGNKLAYTARKKSNDTILSIPRFDIDEKDTGIVNGFKYAKNAIEEIVPDEKDLEKFKKFFREKVHIIHYQVPKDIDLNHYFEIMNSRGEQLEKHEIIKARLMNALKDQEEKSKFNAIWENCSDMGVYIQYKYKEKDIFGKNLCNFEIKDFSELPSVNRHNEDYVSIRELINNEEHFNLVKPETSEDKPDTFQPIIDFPNFLLIVLKLTLLKGKWSFNPLQFNLDDKELLKEFAGYEDDENFVKTFGFNLLKAKYLLDNYVVHHSKEDDTIDNNPWKLQYWQKDSQKDNKKGYLKNLSSNLSLQQKLLQLLSMFEVSFTPRQRKNYLFYCLVYLFDQYDGERTDDEILPGYAKFIEDLADKYFYDVYLIEDKLNNINVPKPGSFDESILKDNKLNLVIDKKSQEDFNAIYGDGSEKTKGIPLFVFNYLDYKIWKGYSETLRSAKYKEGSRERNEFFEKLGCLDFGLNVFEQFYFSRTRRSLEHYYPQANLDENITESQINCFGNFAMIGSEANSSGSNWSPRTKLDHYLDTSGKIKQISVASLKFMIMMQICKNKNAWTFEEIKQHHNQMLKVLFNGF